MQSQGDQMMHPVCHFFHLDVLFVVATSQKNAFQPDNSDVEHSFFCELQPSNKLGLEWYKINFRF
jgi:hypothetical protein